MLKQQAGKSVLCITKSTGGLAVYNRVLASHLHDIGYGVHVICLSDNRHEYAQQLEDIGLSTSAMEMARYKISPFSDFRLFWRINRNVRQNETSVIIAHGAKAGFIARLVGRLNSTPTIYVLHSLPFLKRVQGRRASLIRLVERMAALLGGHLVAITESMRSAITQNRITRPERIKVIYTGINPDGLGRRRDSRESRQALGLNGDHPVVAWAGRLNRQKAPADFVRAAAEIKKTAPNVQFLMAGEGPLESEVRQLVADCGLQDNFRLVSWQKDVATLLSACDVYVMTSLWEGLPLSLLEAMALECPVAATSVDGVAEVIRHGIDGVLVPAGNYTKMAGEISSLLADKHLRKTIGQAARTRVEESFSIQRMLAEWDKFIRQRTRK